MAAVRATRLATSLPKDAQGALRSGRGIPGRPHAGAGLPPCPRPPLSEGTRGGVLRLLRSQVRAVLQLAAAPDRHADRVAGGLRPTTGWAARPDAAQRADIRAV